MPAQLPDYETEDAFRERPASSQRVELLDGEVVVSPSATPRHQWTVLQVQAALLATGVLSPRQVVPLPLDLWLGPGRIVQPDLFVLAEGLSVDASLPLRVVPRLCVEVISPSSVTYDRHVKRLVYAETGVPEYWVIDPDAQRVEVFHGPGLVARQVVERALVSPTLALTVDVTAWW